MTCSVSFFWRKEGGRAPGREVSPKKIQLLRILPSTSMKHIRCWYLHRSPGLHFHTWTFHMIPCGSVSQRWKTIHNRHTLWRRFFRPWVQHLQLTLPVSASRVWFAWASSTMNTSWSGGRWKIPWIFGMKPPRLWLQTAANQARTKRQLLERIYGSAFPMKMDIEHQILNRYWDCQVLPYHSLHIYNILVRTSSGSLIYLTGIMCLEQYYEFCSAKILGFYSCILVKPFIFM